MARRYQIRQDYREEIRQRHLLSMGIKRLIFSGGLFIVFLIIGIALLHVSFPNSLITALVIALVFLFLTSNLFKKMRETYAQSWETYRKRQEERSARQQELNRIREEERAREEGRMEARGFKA